MCRREKVKLQSSGGTCGGGARPQRNLRSRASSGQLTGGGGAESKITRPRPESAMETLNAEDIVS